MTDIVDDNESASSRFAHLLRPIRDLAENWSIDISSELEDYLGELSKISFTLGGVTKLNFAEAALLIQGSAVIYSKKVEYLYSLLYQTLDHLADKRKRKEHNSSLDKDGNDKDILVFDDGPEFLPLDDVLVEADDIDLNDHDDFGGGDGPDNNNDVDQQQENEQNPKQRRQRQRKEKDGANLEKDTTLNMKYGSQAMAMLTSLSDRTMESMNDSNSNGTSNQLNPQQEGETKKYDFKMNTCQVTKSGALLLSSMMNDEEAIFGSTISRYSKFDDLLPTSNNNREEDENNLNNNNNNINNNEEDDRGTGMDFDMDGGGGAPSDDSDYENDGGGGGDIELPDGGDMNGDGQSGGDGESSTNMDEQQQQERLKRRQQLQQQQQQQRQLQQQKKHVNLWVLLDPHEETTDKPFQKGRTYRIPSNLKSPDVNSGSKNNAKPKEKKLDSSLECRTAEIIVFPQESMALKGAYFKDLSYIYREFIKQSRSLRMSKNQKMESIELLEPNGDIPDEVDPNQQSKTNEYVEAEYNFDDSDEDYDNDGGGGGFEWDESEPIRPDTQKINNISEGDDYMLGGGDNEQDESGNSGNRNTMDYHMPGYSDYLNYPNPSSKSYEDLCQSYINQYMASANQYLKETSLMKRMNDWTNNITPLLEKQNARPKFDIVEYSSQIIDDLAGIVKKHVNIESGEPLDDQQIDRDLLIRFEDLMVETPAYEVSRRFASCLQLVNNGNIEIIYNKDKKTMNDVGFHLITTKAKFGELENYDAQQHEANNKKLQEQEEQEEQEERERQAQSSSTNSTKTNKSSSSKSSKSTTKSRSNNSKNNKKSTTTTKSTKTTKTTKSKKKQESDSESESEQSSLSEMETEDDNDDEDESDYTSDEDNIKKKKKKKPPTTKKSTANNNKKNNK
ncbi:hypothetical protein PPL_02487 [Heterostelium album PN500]|uniref:Condensin-2 complex subunit H2 n=1 Tax=Heterostelium pallidum (strain ATCC 26659 / Pp 5 / PN500) TaxID=670386 RepID=D3B279_HETP5|nr:hypothetical protein PPL_02487 [Heterostelium album PN500]EFA84454.1 hypothetical protein PPL_02487 [Heterostelium album PN500]|eukprot:XP_020436568.1 hypothetical protein PPL_02487 [Heterostelium album PN500]